MTSKPEDSKRKHICICTHPIWVTYTFKDEETGEDIEIIFEGFPTQVVEDMGASETQIQKLLEATGTGSEIDIGTLKVVDNREKDKGDGRGIEYILFPIDTMEKAESILGIKFPDEEYEESTGLDGIIRGYFKVMWKYPGSDGMLKKYDVIGHIVSAGCEPEHLIKEMEVTDDVDDFGKRIEKEVLACDEKSIYIARHPEDEWIDHHIAKLIWDESIKDFRLI